MANCGCGSAAGCRCAITVEADDGCNPVSTSVTGAGSAGTPFVIGTTWDPSRAVRLDGNEPWDVETVEGCQLIVPRCEFEPIEFQLMCDAAGTHVGYAWMVLECEAGTLAAKYQALSTTTVQTSKPSGWSACCTESGPAGFFPMYTDADDLTTLVGYVLISYDIETGVYTQKYLALAGSVTSGTIPVGWLRGACGATESGTPGDPDVTLDSDDLIVPLTFVGGAADVPWTNMPLAEDFFLGSPRIATRIDLTAYTQARLVVRKMGTAGAAASKLNVQYSTTNPGTTFVGANWSNLTTSEIAVATNVTDTVLTSSWVNIETLAKADVYIAIIGSGGDGALDPIFGTIVVEFKKPVLVDVDVTGGGGGGGGSGPQIGSTHLYLFSDNILNDTKYPDWQAGSADSRRVDVLTMPPGMTAADWTQYAVVLTNVGATTTADFTLTLKNITDTTDIATVTIPSGTAPTNNRIRSVTAIASGSWSDGDAIQWHIEEVEDGVAWGLHAEAFYELS